MDTYSQLTPDEFEKIVEELFHWDGQPRPFWFVWGFDLIYFDLREQMDFILEDAKGNEVRRATMPRHDPDPPIVIWGNRVFALAESRQGSNALVYREVYYYRAS